uniref:Uncharacterized protein n=1 Tax=Anopheles atroparvus TaxID=41427 RepID=A0A182JDZ7_ANOAO
MARRGREFDTAAIVVGVCAGLLLAVVEESARDGEVLEEQVDDEFATLVLLELAEVEEDIDVAVAGPRLEFVMLANARVAAAVVGAFPFVRLLPTKLPPPEDDVMDIPEEACAERAMVPELVTTVVSEEDCAPRKARADGLGMLRMDAFGCRTAMFRLRLISVSFGSGASVFWPGLAVCVTSEEEVTVEGADIGKPIMSRGSFRPGMLLRRSSEVTFLVPSGGTGATARFTGLLSRMITSSDSCRLPERSRILPEGPVAIFCLIPTVSGVMPGGDPATELLDTVVVMSVVTLVVGFLILINGMVAGGGRVVFGVPLEVVSFGGGVVNGASEGLSATGAVGGMRTISSAGRLSTTEGTPDEDDDTMSDILLNIGAWIGCLLPVPGAEWEAAARDGGSRRAILGCCGAEPLSELIDRFIGGGAIERIEPAALTAGVVAELVNGLSFDDVVGAIVTVAVTTGAAISTGGLFLAGGFTVAASGCSLTNFTSSSSLVMSITFGMVELTTSCGGDFATTGGGDGFGCCTAGAGGGGGGGGVGCDGGDFTFILRLASCWEEISACNFRRLPLLPASFECLPFLRFRCEEDPLASECLSSAEMHATAYTGLRPIVLAYSSFPIGHTGLLPDEEDVPLDEPAADAADDGEVAADELLLLGGLPPAARRSPETDSFVLSRGKSIFSPLREQTEFFVGRNGHTANRVAPAKL